MASKQQDIYKTCDKAIKAMNRENVEMFGRLKMAKWDEINIIRTVVAVYTESAEKARKRYLRIAFDAYILGMMIAGHEEQEAREMARKVITKKWVDSILDETDFVTLYRFNNEAERKAYRLAEELEVTPDKSKAIDKALKEWTRQVGQYAINFADYAVVEAYDDADVESVMWLTVEDERRCHECRSRHERVYPIDEVPSKPHYGCRCRLVPAKE